MCFPTQARYGYNALWISCKSDLQKKDSSVSDFRQDNKVGSSGGSFLKCCSGYLKSINVSGGERIIKSWGKEKVTGILVLCNKIQEPKVGEKHGVGQGDKSLRVIWYF